MEFVRGIYRTLLPRSLRRQIALRNHAERAKILRQNILDYFKTEAPNAEQQVVVEYLQTHDLSVFPYPFHEKCDAAKVDVLRDDNIGLLYVIHENKKLYFKRSWSASEVRDYYNSLLMEQDIESPHRYLTESFDVVAGESVADVGCAEGNFSLSVVERAGKLYLFETDPEWIEALRATFKPWIDKVRIVNKFVTDKTDDKNVRLDDYFLHQGVDFIKVDVDGVERELLNGAAQLLSGSKRMKLALCAYHNQNDEEEFTTLLQSKHFGVTVSPGYMIFLYDKNQQPPYLRRGVIRAVKA